MEPTHSGGLVPVVEAALGPGQAADIDEAYIWNFPQVLPDSREGLRPFGVIRKKPAEPGQTRGAVKAEAPRSAPDFAGLIRCLAQAQGRLYYRDQSPATLANLVRLAEQHRPTRIVELGTMSGLSLRAWVAAGLPAKLTAVDLSFAALKESLAAAPVDLSRVTLVEEDIRRLDFQDLWDPDDRVLLYVDAHDAPGVPLMEHILYHALPRLPKGSLVVVDDLWYSPDTLSAIGRRCFFCPAGIKRYRPPAMLHRPLRPLLASLSYVLSSLEREGGTDRLGDRRVISHGGVVRMDTTKRTIYLAFTGHEYADGGATIRKTLRRRGAKASFFFTGDFYRRGEFAELVRSLARDGHYLGPHSDKHILYADWNRRDSLLVTRRLFEHDLQGNLEALAPFVGDPGDARVFMPPFEWYNDSIASWCRDLGMTLVNFTPGTRSNADYTYPEMGERYVSSQKIYDAILRLESSSASGLCGHILLMHIGTDARRKDKLYTRLDALLKELQKRGYAFESLGH